MKLEKYNKLLFTILIFITFSFIGWFWELIYEFLKIGIIANHGFLHGPWLPIYGTGGTVVYLLLNRYKKSPLIVFMGSFVFCTIIEYITAWYLETYEHHKWWSYVKMPFNIDGRVCLLYSILFALAGIGCIYVVAPLLKKVYNKVELKKLCVFILLFLSLFSIDVIYSFKNPNLVKKYRIIDIDKVGEIRIFKK